MIARAVHRVIDAEDGASLLEFALIFPVFMALFLGGFDYGYAYYGRSVLIGAMHEAGRRATLEMNNASQTNLDNMVLGRVQGINPKATVRFERMAYQDFTSVGQPEVFVDGNDNGACDNDEEFDDANRNGKWDADAGRGGQGTGSDVVLYTARMTYPTLFGSWAFLNGSRDKSIVARTILRNQPFSDQAAIPRGVCPK